MSIPHDDGKIIDAYDRHYQNIGHIEVRGWYPIPGSLEAHLEHDRQLRHYQNRSVQGVFDRDTPRIGERLSCSLVNLSIRDMT